MKREDFLAFVPLYKKANEYAKSIFEKRNINGQFICLSIDNKKIYAIYADFGETGMEDITEEFLKGLLPYNLIF